MPITYSERAAEVGRWVADQDLDVAERLAIAKDLLEGVKLDLEEDVDAVKCVAEGRLDVSIAGAEMALGLLG